MNPNTVPRFVKDPKTWQIRVSATTPRATALGAGTTLSLVSSAVNGSRLDFFRVTAQGEVSNALLFLYKITVGGATTLFDEISINATSAGSANISDFEAELTPSKPLYLLSGEELRVGLNTTTGVISVFATGGDF